MFLERTPEAQRGFDGVTGGYGIDKYLLAITTIEQYPGLEKLLGHERASNEMAQALGSYVLHGEINNFEADMIATLAVLGNITTNVMDENERLQHGI